MNTTTRRRPLPIAPLADTTADAAGEVPGHLPPRADALALPTLDPATIDALAGAVRAAVTEAIGLATAEPWRQSAELTIAAGATSGSQTFPRVPVGMVFEVAVVSFELVSTGTASLYVNDTDDDLRRIATVEIGASDDPRVGLFNPGAGVPIGAGDRLAVFFDGQTAGDVVRAAAFGYLRPTARALLA